MVTRLCVVGAGVAGAGVAYALRDDDVDVTVLEKSRGVGGRAATRRKHGCRYDHGANYLKSTDPRTGDLLDEIGREGLVDVAEPVWTFDADGAVREGDGRDEHKWTFETGITRLTKRLFAATDADVRTSTRVASATRRDGLWTVADADGNDHGPFDLLCYTPPAPQTAALLSSTELDSTTGADVGGDRDVGLDRAREAVDAVPYRTVRTLVLHYDVRVERPYYALLNTDREHPVGWLAREDCKNGHVPDGESLLVVQMSPSWSVEHYDDPLASAAAVAAGHAADLLDDDRLRDPDWVDDQGWRYAQPDAAVDRAATDPLAAAGLFVAGDWVVGEPRVHAALWNGVETGERIADRS
ncbi:NAD(P)-binding protein [Halorubrum sp. JWXQ-INN 858]|uniref:NAD(P)/FAD-dependent oxidoreductase n=1 Tax=Halorubrum sp. JWXQ-INN 858 TaxID=2690782 RepID=UPI0013581C5F|nr:FAD-dependent oxidoreductase [Halorubrum sp. JWXQ-INN 858]MWV63900.1 NAD(P)-binding protein [Halorubrum sp. JWXQ-INN 858]